MLTHVSCCQFADVEALEHDAASFACETCEVRKQRETLTPAIAQAFDLFDLLARRVVIDFRLGELVCEAVGLALSRAEARLLVELLDQLYEARVPVTRGGIHHE